MMRLLSALLLIASIAAAQTVPPLPPVVPGIVLVNYNTTIQISAGGMTCRAMTANAGLNISIYCYIGTKLVVNSSLVIDTLSTADNGVHYTYGVKRDLVALVFWQPESINPIYWRVTSNGTCKEGNFTTTVTATCS